MNRDNDKSSDYIEGYTAALADSLPDKPLTFDVVNGEWTTRRIRNRTKFSDLTPDEGESKCTAPQR